jgi:hypothetical protein
VDEFFFYCRIDVGVSSSKWTFDFKNGVQINQSICSPINNEFYLAKGTEKFILGRYLLSGMLLMLLSLRPWGVAARPAILENRGAKSRLFHYPCEIPLSKLL